AAWPRWRPAAATAALALAVLATSGGLGAYSTATFSAQVAQFLVLFVLVPVLVALSAPVTLASRAGMAPLSGGPGARTVASLTDPLNMLILATVLLFALYATPLLEQSLQSAPLHLAVNLATLLVGCLFWWSVLGVDPVHTPRPRPHRVWVLLGFLTLMVGVAARIHLSEVLLAGAWFSDLDWNWVDLPADQRRGAELMWGGALLLGPLLAALVVTGTRGRGGRSAPASPASR
ncbi:MAG: cytochrome c oxidase assembly protein, partial [Actinomycetota bacterium]|nr:cytochrome c oxidase assembly protein [Actinomycetota bacterium]